MAKIVMTGGGTSGHVTPNLALLPGLRREGYEVHYFGTREGIERTLIEPQGIPYHAIDAGKLRRYFDWQNFTDVFRMLRGFVQAFLEIRKLRPDVVFSKGGFVAPPVVWASWLQRVPVVIHESDLSPGLANRLSVPFASRVCYAFRETAAYLPRDKALWTGIPIREELLAGDAGRGRELCGFAQDRPVVLVIGGSQGAHALNVPVRASLERLLETFQVCHLCGKGSLDPGLQGAEGYRQFEYVTGELAHLYAAADVVVSRAGATTLFELLALNKPGVLVPLSKRASRGDQILNAHAFQKAGFSYLLLEENLNPVSLVSALKEVYEHRARYVEAMSAQGAADSIAAIMQVLAACQQRAGADRPSP